MPKMIRNAAGLFLFISTCFLIIGCCCGANVFMGADEEMTIPVMISRDQIKQLQSQMLNAFNIKRPSKNAHAPDEFVSKYMTSLYKFIDKKDRIHLNPGAQPQRQPAGFNNVDEDTVAASSQKLDYDVNKILSDSTEYDSIIGFVPKSVEVDTETSKAFGDGIVEINFGNSEDLEIDDSMKMVHSELYFAVENDAFPLENIQPFEVKQGDLVPTGKGQVIKMNDTKLVAFNVTKMVNGWIQWTDSQRTIFLKIELLDESHLTLSEAIKKVHIFGVNFLVEYDEDDLPSLARYKRDASENDINDSPEEAATPPATPTSFREPPMHIFTSPRNKRCQLKTLYIDFNDIGWGDFILAPSGFPANYCDGGCSFPLDVNFNPSNHATVQTLVHLIDKNKTSEALCAPISMDTPLSFLLLDNNRVIIKKFADMTVTKCGCQ